MSYDTANMEFEISIAPNRNSKSWKNITVAWADYMIKKCSTTTRTNETINEYAKMPAAMQAEIKDVGSFVFAVLSGRSRKKSNILYRWGITLDADSATPEMWDDFLMLYGDTLALVYSTHKHTPQKPRLRLVIPFDRPVTVEEYEPICRKIASDIGIDQFDHTTYDVNRLMYWPSTSKNGEFYFKHNPGTPLCADDILASYKDWRDVSEWPVGSSEVKDLTRRMKLKGDPEIIPGIVGDFCRVYDVPAAIDKFLSDVYEPTDDDSRFTFKEGSTAAGFVIHDSGKFGYSHHSTDPSSGTLCNAFDLVRIHKFAHLDIDATEGTLISKLPSHIATLDLVRIDPEVRKLQAIERLESAGVDFATSLEDPESLDWMADLDQDRKGRYETTVNTIQLIMENDTKIKGKFGQNQFSNRLEITAALPWNKVGNRLWSDDDWGALRCYLGNKPYELQRTPKLEDVMSIVKNKNAFHPIKDYLSSHIWDGQLRLETLFMAYLGAQDNPYVRAVTRKTLIAAVARIFEPGIKFEQVLTLVGRQGTGKSTIIRKLGGEWFSDTFSFHMLQGGNGIRAIEQIQGVWIVEIGEMAGLRKAEAEAAKTFISSQEDIYRPSHGKELVHRKRQNIFIGTTNNRDFLISANGNRRFWPVDIFLTEPSKNLWKELTRSEIDQIWAEAVHYYRAGETLELSVEIEALAFAEQTSHEETDEWAEIIESWLERPDLGLSGQGEILRTKVCAADIWELALLGQAKDINNYNTKRIHNIMRKIDGWQQSKSKVHFTDRPSKQTAYYRVEKSEPQNVKWNLN
jgi:putative DNA primase/helicase